MGEELNVGVLGTASYALRSGVGSLPWRSFGTRLLDGFLRTLPECVAVETAASEFGEYHCVGRLIIVLELHDLITMVFP